MDNKEKKWWLSVLTKLQDETERSLVKNIIAGHIALRPAKDWCLANVDCSCCIYMADECIRVHGLHRCVRARICAGDTERMI